jgi:hypothetical protein
MTEVNPLLRAALYYARRGWPVFPVKPHAKQPPLTPHGSLDATTDLKQIEFWWTKTPRANVALRTGVWGWALDIDRAKGGFETLEDLEHKHGKLRRTLSQITGGKGRQDFYLLPEQAVIKNGENVCGWQGIDIRGENGYVLVQPSIHPSGGKYVWDGLKWQEEEIATADPWLIEAILNGNGTGHKKFELPEKIPHGQQHKYLVSLAGKMRANFMGYDEIVEALWQVNQTRCEKPGPRAHIEQYARSVSKYVPGPQHAPAPERNPPELPARLSVGQVKALDVPPPAILIEGLLPERGLALFTGGQKMGKTILAAQAAIAVATGHSLLDYYRIEKPGPVLIVETDDPAGDASFKDLWTKWDVPDDAPAYLQIRAPFQLGEDFLQWIEQEIEECHPVMLVLDSYLSLRPLRGQNGDIVLQEKQEIAALDELGKRLRVLILLVHHESSTTKSNALLDWDSRGAGTFAITAAAESQLSIARFRELEGSTARLVRSRGRHLAERMMTVAYDANLGCFTHILDGAAASHYPLILEMRRNLQAPVFTAGDLQEASGVSRSTAFRQLAALVNAGAVLRERFNEYRFAPATLQMAL